MKNSILSLICICFVSCMTTGKMDKVVAKYYLTKNKGFIKPFEVNHCEVKYNSLKSVNGFSHSKYKRFYTIPILFFYIYSNEQINCNINPKVMGQLFNDELTNLLNRNDYQKKLQNNYLEIEFRKMEPKLNHKYEEHWIPLRYRSIQILDESFSSETGDIELVCVLKDSVGNVLKNISLSEKVKEIKFPRSIFERRKVFVIRGLDQMTQEYQNVFSRLIKGILEEI